jgi:hypothetical protein
MSSKFDRDLIFKLASVQAKLAVVASSGDVLSDLNDLKEVRKFETELAALISENSKAGAVPPKPLAFVEAEIASLVAWGKEVQRLIDSGDDLLSPKQLIENNQKAGLEKMRSLRSRIERFQSELFPRAAEIRSKIPRQCFEGKLVDQRIRGIWQLKLAADDQTEEIPDLPNLIQWIGETDKTQFKVSELNEKLSAHLKLIEKLSAEARAQLAELESTIVKLESGFLNEAKKWQEGRRDKNRFYDSQDAKWATLESKIKKFESTLNEIRARSGNAKIINAVNQIKLDDDWKKIEPDSELGITLSSIKKTAERDRLKFWILLAAYVLLVIAAAVYIPKFQAYAAANAAAKAEAERPAYLKSLNASLLRANISQDKIERLLKMGGTVVAWGNDSFGQSAIPQGLSGVVAIAGGKIHSLALKSDGTVVAWGDNSYGQSAIPRGLSGVVAIATGNSHSLALKSDGTVVAWGDDDSVPSSIPRGLSRVVAIAAGNRYSLALKSDGTVADWGNNLYGQSIPQGLSGVVAIAAGADHSLALKSDGTVVGWGYNVDRQSAIPEGLSGVVAIAAGNTHSLALKSDGTVVAWGSDLYDESTIPRGLSGVVAVAAGASHSLALKSDGTVVAWGRNSDGQSAIPQALSGVVAIAGRASHSLALKLEPDN